MKTLSMALVAALFLAPSADLLAKERGGKGGGGRDGHFQGMAKKIARKLELTENQIEKMKVLKKKHHGAMRPLGKKVRRLMFDLGELVREDASDKKIGAMLGDLKKVKKAMRKAGDAHRDAMAKILTPTQQAKMALWAGKKIKDRMGHGRRGGKGRRHWGRHRGDKRECKYGDDKDAKDDK